MIDNEALLILMLADQERKLARIDHERKIVERDDRLIASQKVHDRLCDRDDDCMCTNAKIHNVADVRVMTRAQDLSRMTRVSRDSKVDLETVRERRTLKIVKTRMIESDRQRDVRARETAFRADVAKINFA